MKNKMRGCDNPFNNVGPVLAIVISAFLYYYVVKLESIANCECSKDWRRDYIKYFFGIIIIYSLIRILTGIKIQNQLFGLIYITAVFVQVYSLFTYVRDLEAKNCECAMGNIHEFAKYYSMFQLILFIIIAIVGVSIFIQKIRCPNINIGKILPKNMKKK